MVEDTPDDLVHELFTENFWANHPLGRPILGTKETVEGLNQDALRHYFSTVYTAPNLIVAAVGNITHDEVKALVSKAFIVCRRRRNQSRKHRRASCRES